MIEIIFQVICLSKAKQKFSQAFTKMVGHFWAVEILLLKQLGELCNSIMLAKLSLLKCKACGQDCSQKTSKNSNWSLTVCVHSIWACRIAEQTNKWLVKTRKMANGQPLFLALSSCTWKKNISLLVSIIDLPHYLVSAAARREINIWAVCNTHIIFIWRNMQGNGVFLLIILPGKTTLYKSGFVLRIMV